MKPETTRQLRLLVALKRRGGRIVARGAGVEVARQLERQGLVELRPGTKHDNVLVVRADGRDR